MTDADERRKFAEEIRRRVMCEDIIFAPYAVKVKPAEQTERKEKTMTEYKQEQLEPKKGLIKITIKTTDAQLARVVKDDVLDAIKDKGSALNAITLNHYDGE